MKQIRFIHIEKSGGTSVAKFMQENNIDFLLGKNFKKVKKHSHAVMFENEDSFKFCVVRNPYTRLVSFYNYNGKGIFNCSFEEFVKTKLITNRIAPQVMKIYKPVENYKFGEMPIRELENQYQWDKLLVDKIFYLERIDELLNFLNIEGIFPVENKSTFDDHMTYYTPELKEIVADHFRKDFEILGYEK